MSKYEDYCADCGEKLDHCNCEEMCQDNDTKDWQFEYAFESLTEPTSAYKNILPIK